MLGMTIIGKDAGSSCLGFGKSINGTIAILICFLFLSSVFGTVPLTVRTQCAESGIALQDHGTDNDPSSPPGTRQVRNGSDILGGSWFDDFRNNSSIEFVENCSIRDGGIRLDGTISVDSWYHMDWPFRRQMVIDNPTQEDLLDYQVNLDLPNYPGMSYDLSDIRFTYYDPEDGLETRIPYWIQDREDGVGANVWLKVPRIPPGGETTIIMYYGNFLASDESDGDATFVFFDGFDGAALDLSKWYTPETDDQKDFSLSNGALFLYVHDVYCDSISCRKREPIDMDQCILESKQMMEQGGTIRDNVYVDSSGLTLGATDNSWHRRFGRSIKENAWCKYSSSSEFSGNIWEQGIWNGTNTGWHILGLGKNDDNVDLFEDSKPVINIQDGGITEDAYALSIANIAWGFTENGWGKLWTDWIRIRKNAPVEPAVKFSPDSGEVSSHRISLPDFMEWDMFSIVKEEPENTSILMDIMDAATNRSIPDYEDLSIENVDISGLNDLGITSIILRAKLNGNLSCSPFLHSWGVEWVSRDAWRDSFIGNSKVFAGSNVNISGRATAENLSSVAYLRSEMISLPEDMIWAKFFLYCSIPNGTTLNVTIHDWYTDMILYSERGITGFQAMDVSTIDPRMNRNISLRADLSSSPGRTPVLHYWGIQVAEDSIPPTADAGNDIVLDQNDDVYFNAGGSSDNLEIVNYTWSFLYRGSEQTLFGREAKFRFKDAGSFNVNLTVSDAYGNRDEDDILVTVTDITPPVADAGNNREIDQHGSLRFSGSRSLDNTGIVNYTWSFEYDRETIHRHGKETTFLYDIPGIYRVTLRVYDLEGNFAENSILVHVRDITRPLADAGRNITAVQGEPIHLNGNRSRDNVGIENYTWLYFHNGDVNMSYGEIITIVLDDPDEYIITLIISDHEKNTATDNLTITVLERTEETSDENETEKDTDSDGYNDTYENESGSDPYDPKSTPLDWDGDGIPNRKDAYPRDPTRWHREDDKTYILFVIIFCVTGVILFIVCYNLYSKAGDKNLLVHKKTLTP